ncbi:MAG: DUF3794 domain-containing protein [Firmicutes bacterium]|nr:DUF3794 domain-containing protein [Bacillota bacterium]
MEISKGSASTNYLLPSLKSQVNVGGKISTEGEVEKILCSYANVFNTAVECNGSDATVKGRVVFKVVYKTTAGEIRSDEATTEFTEKHTVGNGEQAVNAFSHLMVLDVAANTNSNGEISCSAMVESVCSVVVAQNCEFIESVDSSCCSQNSEVVVNNVVNSFNNTFNIEEDYSLAKNILSVLSVCSKVNVSDVVAGADFVKISGTVSTNVVCEIDAGEKKKIENTIYDSNFSQKIPVLGALGGNTAVANVCISNVKTSATAEGESATLSVTVDLTASGFLIVERTINHIADMFSFTHNTSDEYTDITASNIFVDGSIVDLDGNITLEANAPFATEISGIASCDAIVTSVLAGDDSVVVEGILKTNIFYNSDENALHSASVDVPFSRQVVLNGVKANNDVTVKASILKVEARVKRGKEILVDCKVGLEVKAVNNARHRVLSNVVAGDEKVNDSSAIVVYIVKDGEKLWDIAKKLNTGLNVLREQNHGIDENLNAGYKVMLYKKAIVNL